MGEGRNVKVSVALPWRAGVVGGEEGWVAAGGVSAGEGTGDIGDGEMRRVDRWSVVSRRAECGWRIATVPPLRRPRTETVRKKRRPAPVGMTNFKKGQKRIAHVVRKGRERVFSKIGTGGMTDFCPP